MISSNTNNNNNEMFMSNVQQQPQQQHPDYQNIMFSKSDAPLSNRLQSEDVIDTRTARVYDVERASTHYYDDTEAVKRYYCYY